MLVLMRKVGEEIRIGDDIRVVLTRMEHGKAWIGVDAPKELPVHRQEIFDKIGSHLRGHKPSA